MAGANQRGFASFQRGEVSVQATQVRRQRGWSCVISEMVVFFGGEEKLAPGEVPPEMVK